MGDPTRCANFARDPENAGRMTPSHPTRSPTLGVDPSVVAQASSGVLPCRRMRVRRRSPNALLRRTPTVGSRFSAIQGLTGRGPHARPSCRGQHAGRGPLTPIIRTVSEDEAEGEVAALYAEERESLGYVPTHARR